jgi:hypothetical protein
MYIEILLGAHPILHISRIRVKGSDRSGTLNDPFRWTTFSSIA